MPDSSWLFLPTLEFLTSPGWHSGSWHRLASERSPCTTECQCECQTLVAFFRQSDSVVGLEPLAVQELGESHEFRQAGAGCLATKSAWEHLPFMVTREFT
jgi:hypothetical protein